MPAQGLPAEQRELIFQRFWRGDRRRAGSAGLGLAIVSRIVSAPWRRHQGQQRPEKRAVFSINLRAAAAAGSVRALSP